MADRIKAKASKPKAAFSQGVETQGVQEHRSTKVLQPLQELEQRICRGKVNTYPACKNAIVSASFAKGHGETFHRVDSGIKMIDVPAGCKVTVYSKVVDASSPMIGSEAGSHSVVIKGPRQKFCVEKMLKGGVAIGIEDDADLSDVLAAMEKLEYGEKAATGRQGEKGPKGEPGIQGPTGSPWNGRAQR